MILFTTAHILQQLFHRDPKDFCQDDQIGSTRFRKPFLPFGDCLSAYSHFFCNKFLSHITAGSMSFQNITQRQHHPQSTGSGIAGEARGRHAEFSFLRLRANISGADVRCAQNTAQDKEEERSSGPPPLRCPNAGVRNESACPPRVSPAIPLPSAFAQKTIDNSPGA